MNHHSTSTVAIDRVKDLHKSHPSATLMIGAERNEPSFNPSIKQSSSSSSSSVVAVIIHAITCQDRVFSNNGRVSLIHTYRQTEQLVMEALMEITLKIVKP